MTFVVIFIAGLDSTPDLQSVSTHIMVDGIKNSLTRLPLMAKIAAENLTNFIKDEFCLGLRRLSI